MEMSVAEERFFSSKKSQLAKTRLWLWGGLLIGAIIAGLGSGVNIKSLAFSIGPIALFIGAMDFVVRRQLKAGKPLVTLTANEIEAASFPRKRKRYLWSEIAEVSVESVQGVPHIQFRLIPALGIPDKRSFWSGVNYARPYISLAPFSEEDQERLMDAINARVFRHAGDSSPLENPLAVEREFKDQLKSFAPHPWVLYVIVAFNVLVWCSTLILGAGILQTPAEKLMLWGGNVASEVQHGQWWRLLTATFLHSGIVHLAMNMIGLAGAGTMVERIYGHRQFALIYLGSGLMGSAMSLHFSAQKAVSVGASGAVFGVVGALLVSVLKHRKQLPKVFGKQTLGGITAFLFHSLSQGFAQQGIDNAAHIGGLLGGCLIALILPERFDKEKFQRQTMRAIAAVMVAGMAITVVVTTAPSAVVDLRKVFAGEALFVKVATDFDAAIKLVQKDAQDVKAGKLTEIELDERGRTTYAPMFREIHMEFSQVTLRPVDPREPLLKDMTRLTELMHESLAMESVVHENRAKPEPVDPVRMAAIEKEINEIGVRIQKWREEGRVMQKR